MRLADVVAEVPGSRVATEADNDRILEFFDAADMDTSGMQVLYRRSPDFFRLLRYQSDRFWVLMNEDREGRVKGVATVVVRPGYVDGEPATVGYLGDLRIAFDRRVLVRWRRAYSRVMAHAHEIDELAGCRRFQTAVMDDNELAKRALVKQRRDGPVYRELAPFTMRCILGRVPLWPGASADWTVREARDSDRDALVAFFEEENRRKPFGFRGELERRLEVWEGFGLESIVVALDRGDNVVGCVAPWSPSRAKSTVVTSIPRPLDLLRRPARRLVRIPEPNEPLRIEYLTCLELSHALEPARRHGVLRAMLDHVMKRERRPDWHFLALRDYRDWPLTPALRGYVHYPVGITLYTVSPPGSDEPPIGSDVEPAFEMALV